MPMIAGIWFYDCKQIQVANKLKAIATFINSQGLLHFDAHFKNILTDGQELFFADFGLAICDKFELSKAESDFFKLHYGYDQYYTMAYLVQMWVRTQTFGVEISNWFAGDYSAALHEYVTGKRKSLPTAIAAYLPIAMLMNTFFEKLKKSKTASYPAEELEHAYATAEFFAMNSANKELS